MHELLRAITIHHHSPIPARELEGFAKGRQAEELADARVKLLQEQSNYIDHLSSWQPRRLGVSTHVVQQS
jgi:hypothetical protein